MHILGDLVVLRTDLWIWRTSVFLRERIVNRNFTFYIFLASILPILDKLIKPQYTYSKVIGKGQFFHSIKISSAKQISHK